MKLSFSTLGCPDWNFGEIISTASDLGYDGIEIRGIADQIYAPYVNIFSENQIENTKKELERIGLEIPILTSGAYLNNNPEINSAFSEIDDYIFLASKMGVKYIRILGDKDPAPDNSFDFDFLLNNYEKLCKKAAKYKVSILIETNGILADTNKMLKFIEKTESDNKGIIWDINHTVRYFNEKPQETVKRIGKYIKHVHVKDSIISPDKTIKYMLTGYGDIPIKESCEELLCIGYTGYFSYEWVKRWSRELEEPGIAFYQYLEYMKNIQK